MYVLTDGFLKIKKEAISAHGSFIVLTDGILKIKKEVKSEKPDALGNVKFESPILSIDPGADPEESKESPEIKVSRSSWKQWG